MSNEQQTEKKLTATQRLENLEGALMQAYQTMNNIASDLITAKEAIKLLGNKCDSIQKAAGFSNDQIANLMIENNVTELKEKADALISNGTLVAAEVIGETSFVVGKEVDTDGTVTNPRLQFAVQALVPEAREKLQGAKAGETVSFGEGKLSYLVLEVYDIAVAAPAQEAAPVETAPEAAPVETAPEAAQ